MALDSSNTGVLINLSQDLPLGATRHYYNGEEDGALTAQEMITTPGAGRKLILTHVSISTARQVNVTIQNGSSTLIGPIFFPDNVGGVWQKDFKWGLSLTAAAAMNLKTDSDDQVSIYIEYINAPA